MQRVDRAPLSSAGMTPLKNPNLVSQINFLLQDRQPLPLKEQLLSRMTLTTIDKRNADT